jgi:hypothetical protein
MNCTGYILFSTKWLEEISIKLGRLWKVRVLVSLKVISQHLHGAKENYKATMR